MSAAIRTADEGSRPSPFGLPVERFKLPNGLTLLVKENHAIPIVAVTVYVRGGSRAEDPGNVGITTLTQRLLMKGTARRSAEDLAEDLEFLGATMSPFTGKDVFGATLTSLSHQFPAALDIFADCMLRPLMSAEEVEKERTQLVADVRKKRDDSMSYCLELCDRVLFEGHPYRFPVAGDETALSTVEPAAVKAWHGRFYRPDQMVIALVGDVETSHVHDLMVAAFADMRADDVALPPYPVLHRLRGVRPIEETRDKRQVAVALGFHAPAFGHADYFAFDVIDHVLSGMGSRLFIELRDREGLGYVVNCLFDARQDAGSFKIYIGTSEERRERSRIALLEQLQRLRDEPVGAEELANTKRYIQGLYEIALQRNSSQASRLAYYEVMGAGWRMLEEYPQRIEQVTSADLQEAARRWLNLDAYAFSQVKSAVPADSAELKADG